MDSTLIFTLIALFIFCSLVYFAIRQNGDSGTKRKAVYAKLKTIAKMIDEEEISNRDALIRLDNLLAKALQYRYRNDETCGENLKRARNRFSKNEYNQIWTYHKLRNKVVHDDAEVSDHEIEKAFSVFRKSITKIVG